VQVSYYENLEPGLGLRFWDSIETVMQLASKYPKAGSLSIRGTRRVIAKGFPFSVVYFESEDELRVIAIAHFKRMPNYWESRSNES
jgi:toxin ParE1/3/4